MRISRNGSWVGGILTSFSGSGGSSRGRRADHPNPIDVHVGGRVRLRRTVLGLSQEKLGAAIGLTFQQVQKYERGTNRIGASRLYDLSQVLDVPVAFFFEDYVTSPGLGEPPATGYEAATMQRDALELMGSFQRILDPEMRRQVLDLTKAIANAYFSAKGA
jgi:transcriptional regulator with XRE-family HTH domain